MAGGTTPLKPRGSQWYRGCWPSPMVPSGTETKGERRGTTLGKNNTHTSTCELSPSTCAGVFADLLQYWRELSPRLHYLIDCVNNIKSRRDIKSVSRKHQWNISLRWVIWSRRERRRRRRTTPQIKYRCPKNIWTVWMGPGDGGAKTFRSPIRYNGNMEISGLVGGEISNSADSSPILNSKMRSTDAVE